MCIRFQWSSNESPTRVAAGKEETAVENKAKKKTITLLKK